MGLSGEKRRFKVPRETLKPPWRVCGGVKRRRDGPTGIVAFWKQDRVSNLLAGFPWLLATGWNGRIAGERRKERGKEHGRPEIEVEGEG